jgi:Uncharacterized protein conserved in bacteria
VDEKRKQIPLRISAKLFDELSAWAEEDFRSLNGQIEYILTREVKKHRHEDKKEGSEE